MVKVLNKKEQKSVLSMFNRQTEDARKIAVCLRLPRHAVMRFLEEKNLKSYSPGSYM